MEDSLAQRLVTALKDSGISFVSYLPETRLSRMIPLLQKDSSFRVVPTTSESEAVSIAAGAALTGNQAPVYMEGTGVYVSAYSLFAVGERFGVPMLTATACKTELEMTAKGTGIEHAITVRNTAAFEKEIVVGLRTEGLRFIVAKVEETLDHRKMTRPNFDLLENKYRFVRYLERTKGKAIFLNERAEGKKP